MASLRPTQPKPAQPLGPLPAQTLPAATTNSYGINWGNAVSDPNEQSRILGLATDFVNRNEAGGGFYQPGHSREQAIRDAAYSFFPTSGGGAGAGGGGAMGSLASLSTSSSGGPYAPFVPPAVGPTDPTEGEQAIQRSAAARGTLLNGGTLKALEKYRHGLQAGDQQQAFDNSLKTYLANRDTAQQNASASFRGSLDIPLNNPYSVSTPNPFDTPGGVSAPMFSTSVPSPFTDYAQQVQQQRQALTAPYTPPPPTRKNPNWRFTTLADALPGPAFGVGR
jgi:hypothetical protein